MKIKKILNQSCWFWGKLDEVVAEKYFEVVVMQMFNFILSL